jgi:geranylgeranyl diphosphate synthase type I
MEYAIPCGIAFQLQDDVIGLFGDEEKTGKSAYSDIKEGKKTLLMLKTMELATAHEKEII